MGWTVYLSVYKKTDGSSNEEELKNKIEKICNKQLRIPGCEPLWTDKNLDLDRLQTEQIPNYRMISFYFCKVQSSWNPFLSIWLTILMSKYIVNKFSDEIYISIHDDFGYPFEKVKDYSYLYISFWVFFTALLTPLWLIFMPLMMLFKF